MVFSVHRLAALITLLLVAAAAATDRESRCDDGRHYQFVEYLPSTWEVEWLKNGQEWRTSICDHMRMQKDKSIHVRPGGRGRSRAW